MREALKKSVKKQLSKNRKFIKNIQKIIKKLIKVEKSKKNKKSKVGLRFKKSSKSLN